jgi:hypothetical protein
MLCRCYYDVLRRFSIDVDTPAEIPVGYREVAIAVGQELELLAVPGLSKHIAYRLLPYLVVLELSEGDGVVYAQVYGVVYRAVLWLTAPMMIVLESLIFSKLQTRAVLEVFCGRGSSIILDILSNPSK